MKQMQAKIDAQDALIKELKEKIKSLQRENRRLRMSKNL